MSIATELNRILQAKQDIRQVIKQKGVRIPKEATLEVYDTYIDQISNDPITTPRTIIYPIEGSNLKRYELYNFPHIPSNQFTQN